MLKTTNNSILKNRIAPICFVGVLLFTSCKKDKAADGIDKELFDLAKVTTGFVWYKNSDTLLEKSAGSSHAEPFLRTRYNALAATQLDSMGKVKSDAVFPDGSVVVKELFDNATTIGRYAVLYKKAASESADANGWVWGYIKSDGTVTESATKKGSSCINCHSQSNNIDYMLMNKYFP